MELVIVAILAFFITVFMGGKKKSMDTLTPFEYSPVEERLNRSHFKTFRLSDKLSVKILLFTAIIPNIIYMVIQRLVYYGDIDGSYRGVLYMLLMGCANVVLVVIVLSLRASKTKALLVALVLIQAAIYTYYNVLPQLNY